MKPTSNATMPDLRTAVAELIACPSISSTQSSWDQGNRQVIERLHSWCESLGFRCETLPAGTNPDKLNLIARAGPEIPGRGLVLSGHADTVPYDADRWSSDPFRLTERDNRWYGLGATDMKSFFALALDAARDALPHLKAPLTLVATADEESTMEGARTLKDKLPGLGEAVIIGEPTGLQPIYAHKGILMEELAIEGRSGHSSEPQLGSNAIDAMQQAIQRLDKLRTGWRSRYHTAHYSVPSATLNFGCIHGGDNPNRICAQCRLQFDVRLVAGLEPARAREEIYEALSGIERECDVKLSFTPLFKGVSAFESDADSLLIRELSRHSGMSAGTVAFATEAPFFQQAGMSTVVWGAGDIAQAHQPDEFLGLDRIKPALQTLQSMIRLYCIDTPAVSGEAADA